MSMASGPAGLTAATNAPGPGPVRVAVLPVLAVSVVLLAVSSRYGPHWDELYFRMLPLRWWYEDQPPLTVWLTWLAARVSDALWVQRLPAVASAAAGVVVAGLFARSLGAGPGIQRLAAWAHAFTVYPLLMGHVFTTAALDTLAWQVIVLLVLRATQGHPRALLWVGVVGGVACWNKLLVIALLAALFLALLLTDRRVLLRRETAAAAALFAVLAGPQVFFQVANGLPMARVSAGLVARQGDVVRLVLVPTLALFLGPPLVRVWWAGLVGPWRADVRTGRFLLPAVLLLVGFTLASPSQPYYPVAALLPALAMGWASPQVRQVWTPQKRHGVVAANAAVACVICLPVWPASEPWLSWQSMVNPVVRDELGWRDYALQIEDARGDGEAVVTDTYVLAGAVHRYGTPSARASVYSGHNALWSLGPPRETRVLLVGRDAVAQKVWFRSCSPAGQVRARPVSHAQLADVPMVHCEEPVVDWDTLWPRFARLSG